jgi:hypothetical protein
MPQPRSGGSGCFKFFFFILILFIIGSYFSHRAANSPAPAFRFDGGGSGTGIGQSPMMTEAANTVSAPTLLQEQAIDKNGWVGVEFRANCRLLQPGTGRLVLTFADEYDRPLSPRNDAFAFEGRLAASSYFNALPSAPRLGTYNAGGAAAEAADVTVFLPYDQLQLPAGQHTIHVHPTLLDSTGRQRTAGPVCMWRWRQTSSYITRVDVSPRNRLGISGIAIRADFCCDVGPSGGPAMLTAHFIDRLSNVPIDASSQGYRDRTGKLFTSTDFRVAPGRQVFRGIEVFLPDDEIPVASSHDLDANLSLFDSNSGHYLTSAPVRVTLRKSGR